MPTYVALYRGESLETAKVVDVCTDPAVVAEVAAGILARKHRHQTADPVLNDLQRARTRAVRAIQIEAQPPD